MNENGAVYIPVNLEIDEAQKQLESLAKKGAKTKIEIELNTAELEKAEKWLEEIYQTEERIDNLINGLAVNKNGKWVANDPTQQAYVDRLAEAWERLSEQQAIWENNVDKLKKKNDDLNTSLEEQASAVAVLTDLINGRKGGNGQGTTALDTFNSRIEDGMGKVKEAGGVFGSFGKRLAGLAKRVFVFSVVTSALRNVRTAFSNLIQADDALSESLNQLKGNLLTLVAPLINTLLPAFRTLVDVLNLLIQQIGSLVFSIFGIKWGDASKSAEQMSKSFGKTAGSAKEIKKSLMGIDEINRLDDATSGGGGAGGGSGMSFNPTEVTDKLLQIEAIALGATLALGVILTMTGANIPLGLGLITVGALGLASQMATNWNSVTGKTRSVIATITGIASGALLALGVLLTITGHLGMGIPMIIAGVAGTISALAFSWTETSDRFKNILTTLMGIVAGAMAVIGMFFLITGANVGLGLALLAGAVGVSAIAFNFDWITNKVKNVIETLKQWLSAFIGLLKAWWNTIKDDFSAGVEKIKSNIATIKEKITSVWDGIKNWFNTSVKPKLTVDYWLGVFSTIKDGLSRAVNNALNSVFDLINRAIYWINERLNFKWQSIKIAGVEVLPAGSKQIAKIKEIPKLAEGSVVPPNRQFLAMLGDNTQETEVVSPLSTMKEALAEALAESNQHITVNVDGRQLFDIIVGQNNAEVRRTGATPLMV